MLTYDELTTKDLDSLPRDATVFALAMSPIEVNGPRLAVSTDVMMAEHMLELAEAEFSDATPNLTFVSLPSLYLGADTLPVPGSLGVSWRALESILYGMGRGLAKQGFKYLLVTDNHGGPSHQMAVGAAVRSLWRKHRFYCVAPCAEMDDCQDSPVSMSVRLLQEALSGKPPHTRVLNWAMRFSHRFR